MSNLIRPSATCLAICAIVAFSTTAVFAVPPGQMLHDGDTHTFSGKCCMSFNESITVIEPAKPVAVVVTWHLEKLISQFGPTIAGLMVNGGPCTLYGSGFIPGSFGPGARDFQWIIFPSDGLQPGTNTFTLCGGGVFDGSNFAMQEITLDARLSN